MSASASRRLLVLCVSAAAASCAFGLASCADLSGLDTGAGDGAVDEATRPDAAAGADGPGPADAGSQGDADATSQADADATSQADAAQETAAESGAVLDAAADGDARPDDGPAPDAAHDGPAETSSTQDAADGATDAPADADGSIGTWCAQQTTAPTFCSDFDTPPLATGWTGTRATNGSVALDPVHFVSGTASLLATTNAFASSGTGQAVLYKTVTTAGSTVHFELQLAVATIDPHAQLVGAELVVLSAANADLYRYSLVVTATGSEIQEAFAGDAGNVYKTTPLGVTFTPGTFYPVQIDLVLPTAGGPSPTGTVHVGGNLLVDHAALFDGAAQGTLQIDVGAQVFPSAAIGSCQTNADNVLLNIGP
jgi:hypothetical protein